MQQNINRSLKRYARMTGRDAPTDAELKRNLHKRVLAVEDAAFAKRSLSKRYNRHGVPGRAAASGAKSLSLKGKKNKGGKGQGQGA